MGGIAASYYYNSMRKHCQAGGFQEAAKKGLILCRPISLSQLVFHTQLSQPDAASSMPNAKDGLVGVPWVGGRVVVSDARFKVRLSAPFYRAAALVGGVGKLSRMAAAHTQRC